MSGLNQLQLIAVAVLPLIFAITVHEVAHGWVALRLGDPTAQRLGRLTLNPIKHIDPIGTIVLPLFLLYVHAPVFGWAKPVPVTWENLRHPKRDMALVAAAGPGANLVMALFWIAFAMAGIALADTSTWFGQPMAYMGAAGIKINIVLMVLNLLPLPPLDGGRVAVGLLPNRLAWQLGRIEPYGIFVIIALLVTGLLVAIIGPPIEFLQRLMLLGAGFEV